MGRQLNSDLLLPDVDMPGGDRPKELYIDEKWDKCIDISLRRVVYGTLTGGVLALVLFSRPLPAPAPWQV